MRNKNSKGNEKKNQKIDLQKEYKDQAFIKMCQSYTKKEEGNLEIDRFSSIGSPKIAVLGSMGEHKKGPPFFSGYQNAIRLLISRSNILEKNKKHPTITVFKLKKT